MSALITSEIFRLLGNTLTTDDKYSRRYIQILWETNSNAFISKSKILLSICDCISEMFMKFKTFWKKRRVSYPN